MKIKILLLILLPMLVGCNDNEKENKNMIKVEADAIHLWPGSTKTVSIISDGSFSVKSSDPTVAQATVDDKTLIVTATGVGRTSLLLKGNNHEDLQIKVSTILLGLYTEEHIFEEYAPKISVTADSKEIAESIIRELTTEMSEFDNAHYSFEADGRFSLGFQKKGPNDINNPYWGTFSWDGKILVLNYGGKSEKYSFKGIYNGSRPYIFSATLNLTDKYKVLYPNAGIKDVSVERFISAIPPFPA